MIDIQELRKLAEAATRGPWTGDSEYDRDRPAQHPRIYGDGALIACVGNAEDWIDADDQWQANAAFILAANPAAVLELIKRIESKEETLDVCENVIGTMPELIKEYRDRANAAEARVAELLSENRDLAQHCTSRREAAQMWMARAKAAEAEHDALLAALKKHHEWSVEYGPSYINSTLYCVTQSAIARAEQEAA